jgi:5-methyltetrahydrofolate corrinoid/iron sulfur protein methyltransferase
MYVISERINGMFTAVKKAIARRDQATIQKTVFRQIKSGAQALDLNVGTATEDQIAAMIWLIKTVREVTDLTICLDNPKFEVIQAGAEDARDNFIINSTKAKEADLEKFLPLAAETGSEIIALTLAEKGVPNTAEGRVEIAARIIIAAQAAGISPQRIYLDPITLPINIAQDQPKKMLETITQFKLLSDPPPRILIGLSNLSQRTTEKSLLTATFLAMAMGAGLDAAILDPEDKLLMDTMITGEVVLNHIIYNDDYLKAYRASISPSK